MNQIAVPSVEDARRIAADCGLWFAVHFYGRHGETSTWYFYRGGSEVGHWVPATRRYRIDRAGTSEYGGPLAFEDVCERLAEITAGNAPAPRRAARTLRKSA